MILHLEPFSPDSYPKVSEVRNIFIFMYTARLIHLFLL